MREIKTIIKGCDQHKKNSLSNQEDLFLVAKVQKGDQNAMLQLIDKYSDLASKVVSDRFNCNNSNSPYGKTELEEIIKDKLEDIILGGLKQYSPIPDIPFRGYLKTIAINAALASIKRRLKSKSIFVKKSIDERELIMSLASPESNKQRNQDIEFLNNLLDQLSPKLALILKTVYGIETTKKKGLFSEAARMLSLEPSSSSNHHINWIKQCAEIQIEEITSPILSKEIKKKVLKCLKKISIVEQEILYLRYGLSSGLPLTCPKLAQHFYPGRQANSEESTQSRTGQYILRHITKILRKISLKSKLDINTVKRVLMFSSGRLKDLQFKPRTKAKELRRSGPTKINQIKELVSSYEKTTVENIKKQLNFKTKNLLSLIINSSKELTASDLARLVFKPGQSSTKSARQRIDNQLNTILRKLTLYSGSNDFSSKQKTTTFTNDLINEIKSMLKQNSIEILSKNLTTHEQNILETIAKDPKNSLEALSIDESKYFTPENRNIYSELKIYMKSRRKNKESPVHLSTTLKRIINKIKNPPSPKKYVHQQPKKLTKKLQALSNYIKSNSEEFEKMPQIRKDIIILRLDLSTGQLLTLDQVAEKLSTKYKKPYNSRFVQKHITEIYKQCNIATKK